METNSYPAKGTAGFTAAIDRPDRSKLPTCRTVKLPTRAAAVAACIAAIETGRVRVKSTDTITTTEWQATGDGSWQIEMMKIISSAERVTVGDARIAAAHTLQGSIKPPAPEVPSLARALDNAIASLR